MTSPPSFFITLGFLVQQVQKEAVQRLGLKRDDTVVEPGCGTGKNFRLFLERIGPRGGVKG